MPKLAPSDWGIPSVAGSTERDALFPTPAVNQRVDNRETGSVQRWNGASWVTAFPSVGDVEADSLSVGDNPTGGFVLSVDGASSLQGALNVFADGAGPAAGIINFDETSGNGALIAGGNATEYALLVQDNA